MNAVKHAQPIVVLGAGSWGTALAIHLANSGHDVLLWGNETEHIQLLSEQRSNQQFLPDINFPDSLQLTASLERAMASPAWVLLAIPSHAYRVFLQKNAHLFTENLGIAWASKGLEEGTGKLIHQVLQEVWYPLPLRLAYGPFQVFCCGNYLGFERYTEADRGTT